MSFLHFLSEHRNTFLTVLNEIFRFFGEESLLIVLLALVYLALDKTIAKKAAFSYFFSGITAQGLKILIRVPRPFTLDPTLQPLGSAMNSATGFSFPSGHTQGAGSVYFSVGCSVKNKILKIGLFILPFLVGFSRMYAGVHTPLDVCGGLCISLFYVVLIEILITCFKGKVKTILIPSLILILFSFIGLTEAMILTGMNLSPYEFSADLAKTGGAAFGFCIAVYVEERFSDFSMDRKWWIKTIRVVVGVLLALGLKAGLKPLLSPLNLPGDYIRYAILTFVMMGLFPILISKLEKKFIR